MAPDFLVELATSSNSLEPDASVRLNAVSSATAIRPDPLEVGDEFGI